LRRSPSLLLALAVLLTGCTLAGDVTPPPGSALIRPPATQAPPPSSTAPSRPPDLSSGAAIYQERCAPCHGESGQGDGEQAGQLPVAPAALADPELAAQASPADWYQTVTEGRIDRFMPPFVSLTDQQRWDVVAYSLSLGIADSVAAQARPLYADHCAECHGPAGEGAERGPALAELANYAQRSRDAISTVIAGGQASGMPGFEGALSPEEIDALAALVQRLPAEAQTAAEQEAGDPPPVEDQAAAQGRIQGRVTAGTEDSPINEPVEVTLHAFDGQQEVFTETATANGAAGFSFGELEVVVGRLYVVTAEYEGVRYSSEVAHLTELGESLELDVPVFDATADASQVAASRVHLLLEQGPDGTLRAIELWLLANLGEQTVVPVDGLGGVVIALPPEASNLRFEEGQLGDLYQPTEAGFRLLSPIRPGGEAAQIVFSFDLPLDGRLVVRQPLTVPVQVVTVLVGEGGPMVEADNMIDQGLRQAGGEQLHQYDLGPFQAGDTLELILEPPAWWSQIDLGGQGYAWLVGLLALVAVAVALYRWYAPWLSDRRAPIPAPPAAVDPDESEQVRLLQAIAALDDAHEAGELAADEYERQRQSLKGELIERMRATGD